MDPVLKDGDLILVKKYRTNNYNIRGRIIVFYFPFGNYTSEFVKNDDIIVIKRCVGQAGDSVRIINGKVFCYHGGRCVKYIDYPANLTANTVINYNDVITNYKDYRKDNLLNISPIYVPKKGDSIRLDRRACLLYEKIIAYESNSQPKEGSIYIFKSNYYFVVGENLKYSIDSRSWGFLPESFIIGTN